MNNFLGRLLYLETDAWLLMPVVVDCQTDRNMLMTVGNFFSKFKDREDRGRAILKLKVGLFVF